MVDLKRIPVADVWFTAITLDVLVAVRFAWLMPAFRLRVVAGCVVGFIGGLEVNHVRGGSIGSGLLLISIGMFSILAASLGQGAEIRDVAREIHEHPEVEERPQVSWIYGVKLLLIGIVLILTWETVGIGFR